MIILASESPRRKELLKRIVPDFITVAPCVEELESGGNLTELPEKNAILKARAVAERFPDAWVIGSDTAVFADGRMLGKPGSEEEAVSMLSALSGRAHEVISGAAVICLRQEVCRSWSTVSKVFFKTLDPGEIALYMKKVHVLDKAGAYAIQEHAGLLGARWEGELENIIGLPLTELTQVLMDLKIIETASGRE